MVWGGEMGLRVREVKGGLSGSVWLSGLEPWLEQRLMEE